MSDLHIRCVFLKGRPQIRKCFLMGHVVRTDYVFINSHMSEITDSSQPLLTHPLYSHVFPVLYMGVPDHPTQSLSSFTGKLTPPLTLCRAMPPITTQGALAKAELGEQLDGVWVR